MVEVLYRIYFGIPSLPPRFALANKVIDRMAGFVLKRLADFSYWLFPYAEKDFRLSKQNQTPAVVVSMTSFPSRIGEVHRTIETLLYQSVPPNRIILWLSKEQFPDERLPAKLERLKKFGLEIYFKPDDLRSHKKYYYALQSFPGALVITVDDDVYYPRRTLEYLMAHHQKFPNAVIANRAHLLTRLGEEIEPYRKWRHNIKTPDPSFMLVPTGVGGVLYPPASTHDDIFDIESFRKLCFHADDIWLKVATLRANRKVAVTPHFRRDLLTTGRSQDVKLVSSNSHGGGNDVQLKAVLNHFQMHLSNYCD